MGGYLMSVIQAGNTTTTSLIYTGDTTGNLVFTTGGANTVALTLSNTQAATFASNVTTAGLIVGTTALGAGNATRFKNRIINGDMRIDQRSAGASQTFTAAAALAYSVDRWYGYCTGANVTGQQIAGTYASSQNRYQFTGAASVTAIGFGQRIESKNSYDLANQTTTLSCYIANSLLTTVTWTASYATTTADTFGSLASPTVTQIATGTFTVTSTRTQYTTNISIPSAATTGIQIVFTVGAQISGTWVIDTVQLEVGSSATGFEYVDYGTNLFMCQRYYELVAYLDLQGYVQAGKQVYVNTSFVAKRTSPTIAAASTSNADNATNFANNVFLSNTDNQHMVVQLIGNNGGLNYCRLTCNNFSYSAEL